MLGLHCCARALSSYGEWGLLSSLVRGVLTAGATLGAEQRLQRTRASAAVARGLQREGGVVEACGIFPNQASKSCPLHSKRILNHWTTTEIWYDVLSSVQISSVTQSCPTLCNPMNHSTPGLPVHHQLPEFTQTHAHRVGNAIQPSHPLSPPSPPAPNPSQHQGLFQWVNSSPEVAKVLRVSASTSVLPMNTQDWSPLGWTGWISLQSQGTLKSLLQHHSSKASIFWHSAFFTVQLSHPHVTTGKTIALTRRTFVGKARSLIFNMLPRLVITFLPRSKSLLISWLQ